MTSFQIIAIFLAGLLALREVLRLFRGHRKRTSLLAGGMWTAVAIAVAFPALVQHVATLLGIGRGADVVLYVTALGLLRTFFYFFSRTLKLEHDLVAFDRRQAIQGARWGAAPHDGA